jgi:arylsulfatase A-like enzyme
MQYPARFFSTLILAWATTLSVVAAKRPNFVFLVSEDNSIHYSRLYGNDMAPMPHMEKLAEHGLVFDHAFSCAPVCSVARSTLATGMFAPKGGFQYHRKYAPATLPKGYLPWSQRLKEAGWFTVNNRKTDYNFVHDLKQLWDINGNGSWRDRADKNQPFFHMQSFATSHEGSLHFSEAEMQREQLETPKDDVTLAPYHPDTPTFRHTYARYHDKIRAVDAQMGQVVRQLDEDGLLEDTFVFYFGDHGGVLPRGKGYAYESGLHVPLVIRVPENFRHLVDFKVGVRVKGFVNFTDFGATVLHLAGLKRYELMDGRPFLGAGVSAEEVDGRDEAFGYADRFDEKYDLVRTLRKGRFMYHRNFQGYYPDGLQNNYRYRMLAYEEWRSLWKAGKLTAEQLQFFERRPAEQLFDIEKDPHQVKNLAADPGHLPVLIDLRTRLRRRMESINDLSIYPESFQVSDTLADPVGYGRAHAAEIARCLDVADLALQPFMRARAGLAQAINSENPWERYWALQTCATIGAPARSLAGPSKPRLQDENRMVRLRAAEFLGLVGGVDPRETLYGILDETRSIPEALLTFNGVVMFSDFEPRFEFDPARLSANRFGGEVYRRYEYFGIKTDEPGKRKKKNRNRKN